MIVCWEMYICRILTKIYDSNYNILLIHEPDTADSFQEYPYDLVLSGHSHGGQS